jgi:membrane protein DedA with SNARE-associated domain
MFDFLEPIIENVLNVCVDAGFWGYIIIALLIAVENIFPPIPSEIILGLGGALTAEGVSKSGASLSIPGVIIAATVGAYSGAILLYLAGRFFDEERLTRIIDGKIGKLLRLKGEDVQKAVAWFEKRGEVSVLICRCVPIVRSLISIPAGTCHMKFAKFTAFTLIGSTIWNTILVFCGNTLGGNWRLILKYLDMYKYAVLAILIVIFVVVVVYHFFLKDKIKAKKEAKK